MKQIVHELNKEKCPVHQQYASCMLIEGEISLNPCCEYFRRVLSIRLIDLVHLAYDEEIL